MIQNYKFSRKDLDNHVITNKLYDLLRLQESDFGQTQMSDNEIASMFTTETIKLFTDVIYIDNRHNLMVKTWQKVSFNCKLP